MLETFILEEDKDWVKDIFPNFKVEFFSYAEKVRQFGRAMGGIICCINLKSTYLNRINIVWQNNIRVVQVSCKMSRDIFSFLPVYLNCNKWEDNFDNLHSFLVNNCVKNLCVIGDFNGRVSDEQNLGDIFGESRLNLESDLGLTSERHSKDTIQNARGQRLLRLFDDFGLVILNGRTKSDKFGEFTFIGAVGSSVIDLAAISIDGLNYICDFEVISQAGSDHLPISVGVRLGLGSDRRAGDKTDMQRLLPRLNWKNQDKEAYCANLNSYISRLTFSNDIQSNVDKITDDIKKAAGSPSDSVGRKQFQGKEPWFDYDCMNARRKVFRLLKLYRKTSSSTVKISYLKQQRDYKQLCISKKAGFIDKLLNDLANVKNSKDFWRAVNFFKGNKRKSIGNISVSQWVQYFDRLLNPPLEAAAISYAQPLIIDDYLDAPFRQREVDEVLLNLKDGKAPGFDRIPYEFYKNGAKILAPKLQEVFNLMYNQSKVPHSFKRAIVFPLHKKGDANEVTNYRGLSFIDAICKVFCSLLYNRLSTWVNSRGILNEAQAGFRKGYSTADNVFNLSNLIQIKLAEREGRMYCFFVDYTAAFDSIDRKSLFYKLSAIGVSTRFLKIIEELYDNTEVAVWCNEQTTSWFKTNLGVKQGCILSPLLFALFLNDIVDVLEGGCLVAGNRIKVLMYADDIVIVSPSRTGLQLMINQLEEYCDNWNLKVNLTKSKIMVFRKGGKLSQNDRWSFKGQLVEIVNSYKYLGVTMTTTLSWEAHFKDKAKTAKLAMNSVWSSLLGNDKVPMSAKHTCFDSVLRSIVCYCAQVWGYVENNTIESVLRLFLKRIYRLPINTPNYILYIESGSRNIHTFTLRMFIMHILRVLSLDNQRLPKILAKHVIRKKLAWYRDLRDIAHNHNLQLDIDVDNVQRAGEQLRQVIEAVTVSWQERCILRARNATFHRLYATLDFELINNSYHNLDMQSVRWIMKARGELVDLNYKPWVRDKVLTCSLCNLNENETVYHFVARCPILAEVRRNWFFRDFLSWEEFICCLNGWDWFRLASFMKDAWKIRWTLVSEFNF